MLAIPTFLYYRLAEDFHRTLVRVLGVESSERAKALSTPAKAIGSSMFSKTVNDGIRLKNWKMKTEENYYPP